MIIFSIEERKVAEDCDYILELVKENHLVTDDQIAEGWAKVAASSSELNIIDALKLLGYLDENQLLSMLCEQYGLELVDLSEYEIPADVAARISPELAKQYKIVPVRVHDDILTIAIGNPTDMTPSTPSASFFSATSTPSSRRRNRSTGSIR